MDGTGRGGLSELAALRAAISQASQAPSVGNTQPWRWVLRPDRLELRVDETRLLRQHDPDRRGLFLSCGACLMFAQVSLQANGFEPDVAFLPPGGGPDVLAAIRVAPTVVVNEQARRLDAATSQLGAFRRALTAGVDDELRGRFATAVAREEAWLWPTVPAEDRGALAVLTKRAEAPPQEETASYFLVGTDGDTPRDRLRAGQALGRVLLEAAASGAVAFPVSASTEWPSFAARALRIVGRRGYPQVLLRVGDAASAPAAAPWTFHEIGPLAAAELRR